jgi:LytS/YehU family sensor histidine kinase
MNQITNISMLVLGNWIGYIFGAIFLAILLIISLLRYFIRKIKLQRINQITELESLVNNQPFFYGNLNAIKSYVLSRSPMETAQYLTEFTNLLKTVSSYATMKNITLAQEIDAVSLYLELEKKRLNEQLEFFQQIDLGLRLDKIMVKPLFAFKQIEEIIQGRNDSKKIAIYLIINELGEKFNYKIENINSHVKLIIQIPKS